MEQVTDGHATSGAPSKMLYHRAVYGQEEVIQPKPATAKNRLTEEEQNSAGVVVGRLSATGVPERTNAGRDASGGGGDGGGKRKGSSFRRQAAGSAKRRV